MTNVLGEVTVVIRSVGERTEALCHRLILAQGVPEKAVCVVREVPFSKAMRAALQIGLEQDRAWTMCVDADLLLRPGSVTQMLELAQKQAPNICQIQGYVLDKFYGGPRKGGVHLYRSALLEKVSSLIPDEGVDVRPETHALNAMKAAGYPWVEVPYVVGLHDFEQSYQDIFRKCFVHAHKHLTSTTLFIGVWRRGAAKDADYRVALNGFARGLEHYDDVRIDIREKYYEMGLQSLNLREKMPLVNAEWSLEQIECVLQDWKEPPLFCAVYPSNVGLITERPKSVSRVRNSALLRIARQKGLLPALIYGASRILSGVARKTETIANRTLKKNKHV